MRDRNPGRVTYSRSMPFERAVNDVNNEQQVPFGFRFDRAYWMAGLRARRPKAGVAELRRRDARAARGAAHAGARGRRPGFAGQTGPYEMAGQRGSDLADARNPATASPLP